MEFFRLIEKGKKTCVKENPAPCMSKCPLGIDIRDFIRKLNKGLTSAAYNTFALNAVMPGTVCHICDEPCRNICVRKGIDESVNLKALELYCWQQCSNKPKRTYYIREKNKSILICGGGPCELAAAVKLARRGYFVDIFTKEMRLGGKLWEIEDGILPKNVLEKDIDNIISEKYINVYYEKDSIAEDITKQYDAVLLAEEYKENITDSNIFVYTYNDNPLVDVNNGNILSYQIEEFIKIGKVLTTKEMEKKAPYLPEITGEEIKESRTINNYEAITSEEAKCEAERCILCECSRCEDVCPIMQNYHQDYKQLASAILDTVEAQEIDRKRGLYPLMSCLQCGACKSACPVDIDTKSLCIESRRLIHKKKILPVTHYNFWINDMQNANHENDIFIPSDKKTEYIFFPGCQMGASSPQYVEKSFEWLRREFGGNIALWNRCCNAPAYWSGNEKLYKEELEVLTDKWEKLGKPAFIMACPTCIGQLKQSIKDVEIITLWELLAARMEERECNGKTISIFDSCSAREDKALQDNIRTIITKSGYTIEELDISKEHAQCCGYGGLVYSTAPEYIEGIVEKNSKAGSNPYITYCTNCTDSFKMNGKSSAYILDVVFDTDISDDVCDISERRENRKLLKQRLQEKYLVKPEVKEQKPYENITIRIDDEVRKKINKQLLLEDDLKQVIFKAESTGVYVYDAYTMERTAHSVIGYITVWVRYKLCAEGEYQILSAYYHRMRIKGEQDDE